MCQFCYVDEIAIFPLKGQAECWNVRPDPRLLQGRLLEIGYKAVEGQKTTFRYDGLGRRVAIIETASTGATPVEKRYLWCGEEICQERDQNDTVTKRFYPEGEYWVSGAQKIFYNRDNLGSVRDAQLLNTNTAWSDGTHSSGADYDAYGQGSGNGLSFQYAGMFLHQTSGLYLTHYRAYDPKRGRWVSRDPIAEEGGVNLYAYVGGDPVTEIDPLGTGPMDGTPFAPFASPNFVPTPPEEETPTPFAIHGNWCGPNWTGGHAQTYQDEPPGYYLPPTSPTDFACKRHDMCYAECRNDNKCDKKARGQCMTRCDRELAQSVSFSSSKTSYAKSGAIYIWMKFNNFPDPGENPQSCGCE